MRGSVAPGLMVVSAATWSVLWVVAATRGSALEVFCLGGDAGVSPWGLGLSWGLMVVAMMLPLMAGALDHVRVRSLPDDRWRRVGLCLAGYLLVWGVAGAVLLALVAGLHGLLPGGVAFAFAVAASVLWHASPVKQVALNRCHALETLPLRGRVADRAALVFGLRIGGWCFAACWAVMLAALLAPVPHVLAMALAALWIWAERIEPARRPHWGWRLPRRAVRAGAYRLARLRGGLVFPPRIADRA